MHIFLTSNEYSLGSNNNNNNKLKPLEKNIFNSSWAFQRKEL